MKKRVTIVAAGIALAICIVCPLLDLFDQWDQAFQTGHDSEYPLVVLALCVGLALALARLIVRLSPSGDASVHVGDALQSSLGPITTLFLPATLALASVSPPLSLRI